MCKLVTKSKRMPSIEESTNLLQSSPVGILFCEFGVPGPSDGLADSVDCKGFCSAISSAFACDVSTSPGGYASLRLQLHFHKLPDVSSHVIHVLYIEIRCIPLVLELETNRLVRMKRIKSDDTNFGDKRRREGANPFPVEILEEGMVLDFISATLAHSFFGIANQPGHYA